MQRYLYYLLGINSLFSIFYIVLFHKNIFSLPAHLCVASLLHGVFSVVYNYTKSYHFLFLRSLLAGLYGTIWLIFYLLVIMSNAAWGQTITFTMIIKFLPTFPHLLKSMPFPQILIYIGVGSILIINQIIAFWCVWKNNAPISFPFSSARKSLQKTFFTFSFAQKTGIILALLVCSPLFFRAALFSKRVIHQCGEPIVVALRGDKSTGVFVDEHRLRIGLEDEKNRKNYIVPDSFKRKNVIVIIVDAMRADHLPIYGYSRMTAPFMTKMYEAGKFKKVEQANATCACSECGVSSLFFGKTWKNIGYKGFTLVSLLKKAGYETHFLLSGYSRDWSVIYDFFLDDVDNYQENPGYPIGDDNCIPKALATVSAKREKPVFMYIHLMSVHMAGIQSPKFARYLPVKPETGFYFQGWSYPEITNYHDNGILQADDMVRQIFDSLEHKNLLHNSQIWIVSDHGESIGEHGYIAHATHLYESANRFPILIYDEDFSFYKNTKFVRQIDIAPTIVDNLRLPIPSNWEGQSMNRDSIYCYSYHQSANNDADRFLLIAYSDSAVYKFMFNHDFSFEELYDLNKDQNELHNLIQDAHYKAIYLQLKAKATKEFAQKYVYVNPEFRLFN